MADTVYDHKPELEMIIQFLNVLILSAMKPTPLDTAITQSYGEDWEG